MTRRAGQPSERELPKAYLRLDPDIDQKHPDHGWDFMRLLCSANRQRPRGRFASRLALESLFGRKLVAWFYDRGDICDLDDGRVLVVGWDNWQEGDLTVAERVRRTRGGGDPALLSNADPRYIVTPESVTEKRSSALHDAQKGAENGASSHEDHVLSESLSLPYGGRNKTLGRETRFARAQHDDADPAFACRQWLAAHGAHVTEGDGYHRKLAQLVATDTGKTTGDVLAAFETLRARGCKTAKQYVMGAEDLLFPVPRSSERDAAAARAEEEAKRRAAKARAYLVDDGSEFASSEGPGQ